MAEPGWLKTISNHAVISREELMEWLQIDKLALRVLLKDEGLPPPRFGGFGKRNAVGELKITARSRWRVGDVRAWLENPARLQAELQTEISAESSNYTRKVRAYGGDGFFTRKRLEQPHIIKRKKDKDGSQHHTEVGPSSGHHPVD